METANQIQVNSNGVGQGLNSANLTPVPEGGQGVEMANMRMMHLSPQPTDTNSGTIINRAPQGPYGGITTGGLTISKLLLEQNQEDFTT